MSIEMEDFLYELKSHVEDSQTFKDAFDRLSPEEKDRIAALAPSNKVMPQEEYQATFEWLEQIRQQLFNISS